jgi:hypothetical protein
MKILSTIRNLFRSKRKPSAVAAPMKRARVNSAAKDSVMVGSVFQMRPDFGRITPMLFGINHRPSYKRKRSYKFRLYA